MARKIRRDDEVVVLAGKDKGKTGKVLKVLTESDRLIIEGVNLMKKHQNPNPQLGVRYRRERSINSCMLRL